MSLMRKSKITVIFSTLASILVLQEQANAEDIRKFCYKITSNQNDAYILGDVFRQGLLVSTNAKWNNASALTPVPPPTDAKRCDGNTPPPVAAPTKTNYLGNITNKAKFLRMAAMECGSGGKQAITDQYFSIGDAIYYRNCNAGAQTGYVYYWGRANGNSSQCFGSTYPEMFTIANPNKDPVTLDEMATIYSNNNGTPPMTGPSDYALGNAMAAIQIAESARDYMVYPINYMLIEQKKATEQIIGGHCPPNVSPSTCQNPLSPKNGVHPLAWGGAQEAMMTGGWGTNNGATSDFGKEFEAATTVNWLIYKKLAVREILPKNGVSRCSVKQTFANLPQTEQQTIGSFFAPVFN